MQREDFELSAGEVVILVGASDKRVLAIGETSDLVLPVVPLVPLRAGSSTLHVTVVAQVQWSLPDGPHVSKMPHCLRRVLRLEHLHLVGESENAGRCILDISPLLR